MHFIGETALNISTLIYFIWFVPQITLTFTRKSTNGLSLWMHSLLMLGYFADLLYGFGYHLPFQYRLVTIVGLASLFIEHYQFSRYGIFSLYEKRIFISVSVIFSIILITVLYNLFFSIHSKAFYNAAGFTSMFCWLAFMWPQIIKNFRNKSAEGLSLGFVWLSVLTSICDIVTAYALNWALPSKVGAPIGLVKKGVMLSQCYYYKSTNARIIEVQYS